MANGLGFSTAPTLKKSVNHGRSGHHRSVRAGLPRGASWGDDDRIVFSTTDTATGLLRVRAGGGEPTVLTTPDAANGEMNHWYPSVLPGGRGVLFTITAPKCGGDGAGGRPRSGDRTAQDR